MWAFSTSLFNETPNYNELFEGLKSGTRRHRFLGLACAELCALPPLTPLCPSQEEDPGALGAERQSGAQERAETRAQGLGAAQGGARGGARAEGKAGKPQAGEGPVAGLPRRAGGARARQGGGGREAQQGGGVPDPVPQRPEPGAVPGEAAARGAADAHARPRVPRQARAAAQRRGPAAHRGGRRAARGPGRPPRARRQGLAARLAARLLGREDCGARAAARAQPARAPPRPGARRGPRAPQEAEPPGPRLGRARPQGQAREGGDHAAERLAELGPVGVGAAVPAQAAPVQEGRQEAADVGEQLRGGGRVDAGVHQLRGRGAGERERQRER